MAIINGTAGDDIILGGQGNNTLTGGLGRDIFQLTGIGTLTGPNTITDFNPLDDTIQIDLPAGSAANSITTVQSGNNAIINFGNRQLAIVQNTLIAALDNIVTVITDNVANLAPTDIVFNNAITSIAENTSTTTRIKIADLAVTDDNVGTNTLTLAGDDAASFEIEGNILYLKANIVLNFETKTSFDVTVNVDDATVGFTPDTSGTLTLAVTNVNESSTAISPIATNAGLLQLSPGDSSTTTLTLTKVSSQTPNRNELGIFAVDDNNGTINGITPGQVGYLAEVLKRSQTVFSTLSDSAVDNAFNGLSTRTINLPTGSKFGFYLATNSSIEDVPPNVIFSFPSNGNTFQNAQITQPGGITRVAFEETSGGGDRDFNDLIFQIQTAAGPGPIAITQQGKKEILDLTGGTTTVNANFEIQRDAFFNDHVGFYKIEDALGSIRVGGALIKPGEAGYLAGVIQNRLAGIDLAGTNGQAVNSRGVFQGGSLYAPVLISNASTANADFSNVYTAYSLGNADKADHIRLLGDNTFGFEDLTGGGDRDFNDIIVKATFPVGN
jgi:Domain of unknown function (DUF4114)/RTX calcium-binding nonapeptide repeat (4 copies)